MQVASQARRLSTMVSLMMSSQTKDPVTHQATQNLKRNLRHGLSLEGLLEATEEEIDQQICKVGHARAPAASFLDAVADTVSLRELQVGFHATKAMNLKKLAVRLRDLHDGDVPSDLGARRHSHNHHSLPAPLLLTDRPHRMSRRRAARDQRRRAQDGVPVSPVDWDERGHRSGRARTFASCASMEPPTDLPRPTSAAQY